jgi:hypothetical protein
MARHFDTVTIEFYVEDDVDLEDDNVHDALGDFVDHVRDTLHNLVRDNGFGEPPDGFESIDAETS